MLKIKYDIDVIEDIDGYSIITLNFFNSSCRYDRLLGMSHEARATLYIYEDCESDMQKFYISCINSSGIDLGC